MSVSIRTVMAEYDIFGDEISPTCKKCACVLDNVSIDCQHEGKDGYCKRCCKECAVTNGITILGVKNQTTFKSKLCNFITSGTYLVSKDIVLCHHGSNTDTQL